VNLSRYALDELNFAYRCYIYYRWHTYRSRPNPDVVKIGASQIETVHSDVHILELTSSETEMALMASIQPHESVSTAASKLKGASSKLVRELRSGGQSERTWGAGYFAATTGANTSDDVKRYLDSQAAHHGYDRFTEPPVWVQDWKLTETDRLSLQTKHALVISRWHIVLSTWNRASVFTAGAAQAICENWAACAATWRVRFEKVSAVPDHMHAAVWLHPTVAPAQLIVEMMNSSQDLMQNRYARLLIDAGQPRLWKPGAYVGSFGDINKVHIRNYLREWARRDRGQFA
jgi:REP element-mobilizing transposase RayT